jgi:hypothetical protein
VQVIKDQKHRMPGRYPLDPRIKRLEQPEALGLGCRQRRSGGGTGPPRGLGPQAGDSPGHAGQVTAQACSSAQSRSIWAVDEADPGWG